jgi:hypothetical protein
MASPLQALVLLRGTLTRVLGTLHTFQFPT